MSSEQLRKAAENNTWTNVNSIIENSGLELELIQDLSFVKMWNVKNHKEFCSVSNTMKYCGQNVSEVRFCFNL